MLQQYNIKLFHQIPNSPETNLLDHGVWCAMQSKVESLGYWNRQDPCVLAQTVEKVCALFPVQTTGKVYGRWLPALDLINIYNGGNRFVESLQGKLTNNPIAKDNEEDAAFAT